MTQRLEVQAALAKMPNAKTIGEIMDLILLAQTREEAAVLLGAYVERIKRDNPEGDAADIARQNIGYWTGCLSQNEATRILSLYEGAYHPIFGHSHANGALTPEDAFELGVQRGKATRSGASE